MPSFALPCTQCKENNPVGIAQAGSTVRCGSCGTEIEVPGTKILRNLSLIEDSKSSRDKSSASATAASWWTNLLAGLSLAVAAIGLSYGSYLAFLRWNAPIEFGHTEEELYSEMRERAASDPPVRVWDHFQYLVDTGLPKHDPPMYFVLAEVYKRQVPWMIGSLVIGGLALATFLVLAVISRSAKSDRPSTR